MTCAVAGFTFTLDSELVLNYGGFGVVLRATAADHALVAVKLMVASQPHIARAAAHECDVLSGMLPPHPNVVRLHSHAKTSAADPGVSELVGAISASLSGMDDVLARRHRIHSTLQAQHQVHLVAYELLPGRTLYEVAKRRAAPLPEADVRLLFAQLCHAVAHCHENGVAHLDLKLENVLLAGAHRVVLIDFGLARRFPLPQPLQDLAHPPGSPTYVAPEVRDACKMPGGSGTFDGLRADVFSLGVLLYGLATGAYPWADSLPSDPMFERFSRTGQLPTVAYEQLSELLHGMLDVRPERRPSMQQVLAHPWLERAPMAPLAPQHARMNSPMVPDIAGRLAITEANAAHRCLSAEVLARAQLLPGPPPSSETERAQQEPEPVLNLDDGPALILGPVPIERRVPITCGDVQREVEVKLRVRREMERAQELFATAFASEEW